MRNSTNRFAFTASSIRSASGSAGSAAFSAIYKNKLAGYLAKEVGPVALAAGVPEALMGPVLGVLTVSAALLTTHTW